MSVRMLPIIQGRRAQTAAVATLAFLFLNISARAQDKPCVEPIPKTRLVAGTVVTFPSPTLEDADYKYEMVKADALMNLFRESGCTDLFFKLKGPSGKVTHYINLRMDEPTGKNLLELLNKCIGFHEWQQAMLKQLLTLYQINRHHPDAVALRQEYCDKEWSDPEFLLGALFGTVPKDEARRKKAIAVMKEAGVYDEFLTNLDRDGALLNRVLTANRQLEGMGFTCHD